MSVTSTLVRFLIVETLLKGLLQGGEFVTIRATEMVSGGFEQHPPVTPPDAPTIRKVEEIHV